MKENTSSPREGRIPKFIPTGNGPDVRREARIRTLCGAIHNELRPVYYVTPGGLKWAASTDAVRMLAEMAREAAASSVRDSLIVFAQAFQDVPQSVKVMKIGEEFGEACEAYIGLHGLNPRKGKTHSRDDVADELADVAITALVAMVDYTADPVQHLANHASKKAARLEDALTSGPLSEKPNDG